MDNYYEHPMQTELHYSSFASTYIPGGTYTTDHITLHTHDP